MKKCEFVGFCPLKVQATAPIIIFSLMCFAWLEGTKGKANCYFSNITADILSLYAHSCTTALLNASTAAFWFSLYTFCVYNEHSLIYVAMCLDNMCNVRNRPYSVKMNSGIFAAMATIVPCM